MSCQGYVKINYTGRYGNKLFQYFIARMYAEKHNLNLITSIDNIFFEIKPPKNFGKPLETILNGYILNDSDLKNNELPYYGPGIYIFNGYFQNENLFYQNKDKIFSYLNLQFKKEDIFTIHVRLDDYFYPESRHLIINTDYYIDCIKKYGSNYETIHIICDKIRYVWEGKYISDLIDKIRQLNKIPVYNENCVRDDILNILKSNSIVTSNSTFCFWATFFSNAEKIISFPYTGVDVLRNGTIKKWSNDPLIFKYNKDKKFIHNIEFSDNIIDYFEKMEFNN